MTKINLNASMRSNLLSLQQSQALQDATQLRLSTGLKVNSAIDNPSSYYTAQSLNNRAADLTALLDSMGQGIQTIKTANEALQSATNFLTQASAVAMQALEVKPYELSKEWYVAEAEKQNGVVIDNAEDLKKVLLKTPATSQPKLIVIYGNIDINLEDAGFKRSIQVQNGQSLVGTEYFSNINANAAYRPNGVRTSSLNITSDVATRVGIKCDQTSSSTSTISDLSITYSHYNTSSTSVIDARGTSGNTTTNLNNLDVTYHSSSTGLNTCINNYGSTLNLNGVINLNNKTASGLERTIMLNGSSTTNVNGTLVFNSALGNNIFIQDGGTIPSKLYLNENSKIISLNKVFNISCLKDRVTIKSGALIADVSSNKTFNVIKDYDLEKGTQSFSASYMSANPIFFAKSSQTIESLLSRKVILELSEQIKSYNNILDQFNDLIADSSYKGINLLKSQNLSLIFNETRTSKLDINGVDASTTGLGVNVADWNTIKDVNDSIKELSSAINKIQGFMEYFGNNFEIVSNRETFTNNLINTLTEGADKLILADINKESADMLALQTRQQLATNALSLASQSAQSVLKLF